MPEGLSSEVRASIIDQIEQWEKQKAAKLGRKSKPKVEHPFVTISREYGCGGYEVAADLALRLSERDYKWVACDRKVLEIIMKDMGISKKMAEALTTTAQGQVAGFFQTTFVSLPPQVAVHRKLAETIRTIAVNGYGIIVGRAGNMITRDISGGFHVRLTAPLDWRVQRICSITGMKPKQAEKTIKEKNQAREGFYREYLKFDSSDPVHYHMVINNASYSTAEVSRIIMSAMKTKRLI
jgi:hypothetical protein